MKRYAINVDYLELPSTWNENRIMQEVDYGIWCKYDDVESLQAERDRYREALERIKGDRPHLAYKELTEVGWRIELADEALKDTPDD